MGIDIPATEDYPILHPEDNIIIPDDNDPNSVYLNTYEHRFKLTYTGRNPDYIKFVEENMSTALADGEITKADIINEFKDYLDNLYIIEE